MTPRSSLINPSISKVLRVHLGSTGSQSVAISYGRSCVGWLGVASYEDYPDDGGNLHHKMLRYPLK